MISVGVVALGAAALERNAKALHRWRARGSRPSVLVVAERNGITADDLIHKMRLRWLTEITDKTQ